MTFKNCQQNNIIWYDTKESQVEEREFMATRWISLASQIMDEAQAGIKIAGRNINNLRYADDTLMAESEKELNSLLMKVKEESENVDLKLNIKKTKVMASSPITSWQIDEETMETVRAYLLELQSHCRWWLQPWN